MYDDIWSMVYNNREVFFFAQRENYKCKNEKNGTSSSSVQNNQQILIVHHTMIEL